MKKLILVLLVIVTFAACTTKQVQQPKYYSIEEFIVDYMATQQVEEQMGEEL